MKDIKTTFNFLKKYVDSENERKENYKKRQKNSELEKKLKELEAYNKELLSYEENFDDLVQNNNKIIEKLREKISNDTSNEPADDYKLFLEKQDKFYSAIIEFANMIKIDDEKIEKFLGIKVSYTTGLMWSGRGIENRGDLEKGDKILSVNAFDIQIPYENGKELQTNFNENKKLQYINWALGYLERKLNFCVDQHFFSHKVWGEKHIFQFIKLYEGVEYCDDIYEFVDDQVKEKLNNSESSEETML